MLSGHPGTTLLDMSHEADAVLTALYETDPHAVRQTILAAFVAAGGQHTRAALELKVSPRALRKLVARFDVGALIAERWPP